MADRQDRIDELRAFYAELVAGSFVRTNPRLPRAFESVPREAFLPPGPWHIYNFDNYVETPDADPRFIYQDVLVALDKARGINNGQPSLHAALLDAAAPAAGESVLHIGAGSGYYTAILALLVLPGGKVTAYEIDPELAKTARRGLRPFENVVVETVDAVQAKLPAADVIYVNADVSAPPLAWLDALRPGARMIIPWRPSDGVGLALRITRRADGFAVKPLRPCWFIPCLGTSEEACQTPAPTWERAFETRSLWRRSDRRPDAGATAVYRDIWFCSEAVAA